MTLEERMREDARLLVLHYLREQTDYSANEYAIQAYLESLGHGYSADRVRSELAWLDEQGTLVVSGERIQVATLLLRGEDVAAGRAKVPGIARPRPGRG